MTYLSLFVKLYVDFFISPECFFKKVFILHKNNFLFMYIIPFNIKITFKFSFIFNCKFIHIYTRRRVWKRRGIRISGGDLGQRRRKKTVRWQEDSPSYRDCPLMNPFSIWSGGGSTCTGWHGWQPADIWRSGRNSESRRPIRRAASRQRRPKRSAASQSAR